MTNINTFQGDVFIHEYIKHTGDDNNLFGFSGTDTFKIATGGTDRLVVGSDGNVTITNAIIIPDYIYHTGDLNNLFGFSGTDTFKIATGGTDRLTVGSDGAVTVANDLFVSEYIRHSGDTDTYIRFTTNNIGLYAGGVHAVDVASNGTVRFYQDLFIAQFIYHYSDNNSYFGWSGNDTWVLNTNGTEAISVGSGQQLTCRGFVDISSYIRHIGDTDSLFGFDSNDNIDFQTGGGRVARMNSSRNFSIRHANTGGEQFAINANYNNASNPRTHNAAPIMTVTNPAGADGTPIAQFKTPASQTSLWEDGIYHRRGNGDTLQIYTSSGHVRFRNLTRDSVLQLQTNGVASFNCPLLANGYQNNSDDRVKDNETEIVGALKSLFKLKPQTYDKNTWENDVIEPDQYANAANTEGYEWNDFEDGWIKRKEPKLINNHRESGLIAQDIWYDAPELRHIVTLPIDANPDVTKPSEPVPGDIRQDPDYDSAGWGQMGPARVAYLSLIPYTIKALKELYTDLPRHKVPVSVELYSNLNEYHNLVVSRTGETIQLSDTINDKTVHGVISDIKTDTDNYEILVEHSGLGNTWVINTGSNIEAGDYITTSNVVGYAIKQGDDVHTNYTLGKSMIDCDFTLQQIPVKQKVRQLQDKPYWTKVVDTLRCSYMAYSNLVPDHRTSLVETYYKIPKLNIYAATTNSETNVITFKDIDTSTLDSGVIAVYSKTMERSEFTISEIIDTHSIRVVGDISDLINESDEIHELNIEEWEEIPKPDMDFEVHPVYTTHTRTVYYRNNVTKIDFERDGYDRIVQQEMLDVLDENGFIQWEDSGEMKPLYEIRYLSNDGSLTDQSNAQYTSALIPTSFCI